MKQTLRIIAGKYRGKKLHFPTVEGLRPTPDRVRETLFNWLMHDIRGARCLDAFAGSGALGFEALSRGAMRVTLIEQAPTAYNNLVKFAQTFSSPDVTVLKEDACRYFKQAKEQFDIIFLDPPFTKNYIPQCIHQLEQCDILVSKGFLYIESSEKISLNPAKWTRLKLKQSGQVIYGLYQKNRESLADAHGSD